MMPKIETRNVTIFVKDNSSGEMLELGAAEKIELEEIENNYDTFLDHDFKSCSREISISYKPKNISKKRFIKLLMSRKIQRNAANELAKVFHVKRGYYSYLDLIIFFDGGLYENN